MHRGLRNRAYYSARAILWICTLAACKSKDFEQMFPLPSTNFLCASLSDPDSRQLLRACQPNPVGALLDFGGKFTPPHFQWTSNLLLHLSWATRTRGDFFHQDLRRLYLKCNASTPPETLFNLLLMCCNLLNSPVEEDMLKIQDKSYGISCHCSMSYSYDCSLAIAGSGSSGTHIKQLIQP